MGNPSGVRIDKADLDEDDRGIIVTGYVSLESFDLLKVDKYQREELSATKISELMEAHRQSRVPTVELGMRGDESGIEIGADGVCWLTDPTYIVDGLQRITAAQRLLELEPNSNPKIHATVHLNTDFDRERKRFEVLNLNQTRVNGNVILHNQRYDLDVIEQLCRLSTSKTFVLGDKIAWGQSMKRGELISALTFARTIGVLHSHLGPGKGSSTLELANGLQKIMDNTGKMTLRQNAVTFFEAVNVCFGIETVAYRGSAVQLKAGFLYALAKMFSDHSNFWTLSRLTIDQPTLNKLKSFPVNDPAVVALSGASGGKSSDLLAHLLSEHVAKGRRINKLERRAYTETVDADQLAVNYDGE